MSFCKALQSGKVRPYILYFYTTLCTDFERPDLFIVLSVPSLAMPILLWFLKSTSKGDSHL